MYRHPITGHGEGCCCKRCDEGAVALSTTEYNELARKASLYDAITVKAECHDDRGDPPPPDNWRIEVTLQGVRFVSQCWETKESAQARVDLLTGKLKT